jgi:hypothetical protein
VSTDGRFEALCLRALTRGRAEGGVGTLAEKTLHAVVKDYYTAEGMAQEVKIGPFIADISYDGGVIEVQTRQLFKLKGKLRHFLPLGDVTVVYPVAGKKRVVWIDSENGLATKARKSPKTGAVCHAFHELYGIKEFLRHPNLKIIVALIDLDEYRLLNRRGSDPKRGARRYDRLPASLAGEVRISAPGDWRGLVPRGLGETFNTEDFARHAGVNRAHAREALNLLHHMGVAERTGKQGNAWIYRMSV